MLNNGIFNFTDFSGFDRDGFGSDSHNATEDIFNFNLFNGGTGTSPDLQNCQCAGPSNFNNPWYLHSPEVGESSQPYTGAEVLGDLNGLSRLCNPVAVPTAEYPGNQTSFSQGYDPPFNPGMATSIPPWQPTAVPPSTPHTPSFAPTLPYGFWPSPTAITSGAPDIGNIRQVIPLDGGHQVPDPDPFGFFKLNQATYPGFATPGSPVLAPVASSSGPQRSGRCGGRKRKYNPVKSIKAKNIGKGGHENGWDVTLAHFRARLYEIVFDRQPPGGFLPEMALAAKTAKLTKEELKRSPLQDTKAGQGRRPRDVEDFLIGILGEIVPTSTTGQDVSEDIGKKGILFARLADQLESRLVAVNDGSSLRQPRVAACEQTGKGMRREQTEWRVKKNSREKAKRDGERSQMERMSRLFRAADSRHTWTRVEILSFAVLFLFWGSSAFSPGFVHEAPASQELQTDSGLERT